MSTQLYSFREKIEKLVRKSIGCDVEIGYEYQQRESLRFMSLFEQKMVYHQV